MKEFLWLVLAGLVCFTAPYFLSCLFSKEVGALFMFLGGLLFSSIAYAIFDKE